MRIQRVRSISQTELDDIALSDRREKIDALARKYGEAYVAEARTLLRHRKLRQLDDELRKLGVHV